MRQLFVVGVFLTVLFLMAACSTRSKERKLQKFDSASWISDKNGCEGVRLSMKEDILKSKHRMKGMKTSEIEKLLGNPDAQELHKRNQRYYIYFIDPGPDCHPLHETDALALYVRFTAVGIASEFTFRNI